MAKLRVALAGASGTGKTTLMRQLALYYGLEANPIGSRQVAAKLGYASPYDVDAAGPGVRAEFQRMLFLEKRAWEADHESFITDRTCLDNLAYTMLHCPDAILDGQVQEYAEATGRYTHVFYLPLRVHQDLAGDPARKRGEAYHEAYDALLYGLLERYVSGDDGAAYFGLYCELEGRVAMAHMLIGMGED